MRNKSKIWISAWIFFYLAVCSFPVKLVDAGFDSATWDLINESWDTLGDWNVMNSPPSISEISPPGFLHQKEVMNLVVYRYKTLSGGLPQEYTFETRLKIDSFGDGNHRWAFNDGEHRVLVELFADRIRSFTGEWKDEQEEGWYQNITVATETGIFYVWRLVVDSENDLLKVYRDSQYIGIFTKLEDNVGIDGRIRTYALSYEEDHEDYFRIASGLHSPAQFYFRWWQLPFPFSILLALLLLLIARRS